MNPTELHKLIPDNIALSPVQRKSIELLIDTAYLEGQRHQLRDCTNHMIEEGIKCQ